MILTHFVKDADDQCGEIHRVKSNYIRSGLGLDNELEAEQTNSGVLLSLKEILLYFVAV